MTAGSSVCGRWGLAALDPRHPGPRQIKNAVGSLAPGRVFVCFAQIVENCGSFRRYASCWVASVRLLPVSIAAAAPRRSVLELVALAIWTERLGTLTRLV